MIKDKTKFAVTSLLLFALSGACLNMLVLGANGGKMPVLTNYTANSPLHFSFQDFSEIKLGYLADIFNYNDFIYYSIGDLMMLSAFFVSVVFFCYYKIKRFYYYKHLNSSRYIVL